METLNIILAEIGFRLFILLMLFLWPVLAILALPWAWLESRNQWGYTTLDTWKEGWGMYRWTSLKEVPALLFKLGRNL